MIIFVLQSQMAFSEDITIRRTNVFQSGGARTSGPVVIAYIDNGIITIHINRYVGNIFIDIIDESDNLVLSDSCYSNGHNYFNVSFENQGTGCYTICITLDNGDEYSGYFMI